MLPSYFNKYQEIIEQEPVRSLRQHFIHPPLIRTAYAECTPLYQLIKLINSLKEDKDDIILSNVELKIDSFCTFSFKVSRIFLNRYDSVCNVENCFVCSRKDTFYLNLETIIMTVHCNIEGTNNYVHCKYVVIL